MLAPALHAKDAVGAIPSVDYRGDGANFTPTSRNSGSFYLKVNSLVPYLHWSRPNVLEMCCQQICFLSISLEKSR